MQLPAIQSERDYQRALQEITELMDARPNTPEGQRLEALATVVEVWEAAHYAIDADA